MDLDMQSSQPGRPGRERRSDQQTLLLLAGAHTGYLIGMASSLTHLSPSGDQAASRATAQASWVRRDGLRTCDKKTTRTHRTGGARRMYHNLDGLELSTRLSTGVHLNPKATASTSTRGGPTSTRPLHGVYPSRTPPRRSPNSETPRTTCSPKTSATTPDMSMDHDSALAQA